MVSPRELAIDRKLLEAAQRDPGRFDAIYERYRDRIFAFVLKRVDDEATAQDITSETFRIALENLPKFEWRGVPLSAWLYRIAERCCSKVSLRAGREVSLGELNGLPADGPHDDLRAMDERLDVAEAVEQLPASQQEIIGMRFGEDLPIRQVAAATERSEGAVKLLQHRAFRKLRAILTRSGMWVMTPVSFVWRAIGALSPVELTPQIIPAAGGAVAAGGIITAAVLFNPLSPAGPAAPTPTPSATLAGRESLAPEWQSTRQPTLTGHESLAREWQATRQPTPTPTSLAPPAPDSPEVSPHGPIPSDDSGLVANDHIANAAIISSIPTHVEVNTLGATIAPTDPALECGPAYAASVWFQFRPAHTQTYTLSTQGSLYPAIVGIYTGTEGSLHFVACDEGSAPDFSSLAHVPMQAGTTYYILVAAAHGGPGGQLSFTLGALEDSILNAGSCHDQLDNDLNGMIDAADPNCDPDNDGVPDPFDNCRSRPNTDQVDSDGDGVGNVCDYDDRWSDGDGDGHLTHWELRYGSDPFDPNSVPEHFLYQHGSSCSDGVDNDGDGAIDEKDPGCREPRPPPPPPDPDRDHDGVLDENDNCPSAPNPEQENLDGDARGDRCDADDDNDGVEDGEEVRYGSDPRDPASTPETWLDFRTSKPVDFALLCSDGLDNDLDGQMDGEDDSCIADPPDFSLGIDLDGDTDDDCGTNGTPPETCVVGLGQRFTVSVFLNALPLSIATTGYTGYDILLLYAGVTPSFGAGSPNHYWPECRVPALLPNGDDRYGSDFLALGCALWAAESPEPPSSTYTGRIATVDFRCDGSGHIQLAHGQGQTALWGTVWGPSGLSEFREGPEARDTIGVVCGESETSVPPTPTPHTLPATAMPPPSAMPTPTPTPTPTPATKTPASSTAPTRTPTATPTPTLMR